MVKRSPDRNNDKRKADVLPARSKGCGRCDEGWVIGDNGNWVPCSNC